jgi:hypothetical protein
MRKLHTNLTLPIVTIEAMNKERANVVLILWNILCMMSEVWSTEALPLGAEQNGTGSL